MKITGPGRIDSGPVRRAGRIGASDTHVFAADESADAQKAAALTGAGPIAAVETILALQGVEDSAGGRSRGLSHGEQLLHLLDEVRDGLLAGGIPKLALSILALAVAKRRESFAEPKLQTILDEIDLRARVELAKLEQAERAAA